MKWRESESKNIAKKYLQNKFAVKPDFWVFVISLVLFHILIQNQFTLQQYATLNSEFIIIVMF